MTPGTKANQMSVTSHSYQHDFSVLLTPSPVLFGSRASSSAFLLLPACDFARPLVSSAHSVPRMVREMRSDLRIPQSQGQVRGSLLHRVWVGAQMPAISRIPSPPAVTLVGVFSVTRRCLSVMYHNLINYNTWKTYVFFPFSRLGK